MSRSIGIAALPAPARNALVELGKGIRLARIRRGLRMSDLATRALVSRPTVEKVEKGDPTVGVAAVVAALWALGMEQRLAELLRNDPIGEELEARRRPKTARPSNDGFDF